jgi:hypothetical protein
MESRNSGTLSRLKPAAAADTDCEADRIRATCLATTTMGTCIRWGLAGCGEKTIWKLEKDDIWVCEENGRRLLPPGMEERLKRQADKEAAVAAEAAAANKAREEKEAARKAEAEAKAQAEAKAAAEKEAARKAEAEAKAQADRDARAKDRKPVAAEGKKKEEPRPQKPVSPPAVAEEDDDFPLPVPVDL